MSEEEKKRLADEEAAKIAADKAKGEEGGKGEGDPLESDEEKSGKKDGEGADDKSKGVTADELLNDGTSPSKEIRVKLEKFNDVSDKAKLYEKFAPIISKLQEKVKDNPKLLDDILDTADKGDLKTRLEKLEEQLNFNARTETKDVITEAIELWGKPFTDKWKSDIQPLVAQMQKQGLSYREAVQRATFAISPDLLTENKRLMRKQEARQFENNQGKMGGAGGGGSYSANEKDGSNYAMTDGDKIFSARANIDAKLYGKHAAFLKEKGFDQL